MTLAVPPPCPLPRYNLALEANSTEPLMIENEILLAARRTWMRAWAKLYRHSPDPFVQKVALTAAIDWRNRALALERRMGRAGAGPGGRSNAPSGHQARSVGQPGHAP